MNILQDIQFIALDVDGVLCPTSLGYGLEQVVKFFNPQDGVAFGMAKAADITLAVITGRDDVATDQRMKSLRIERYYKGVHNKAGLLADLQRDLGFTKEQTCILGDDLPDVACRDIVGVLATPKDGCSRAQKEADIILDSNGGAGCFRELMEKILTAQNRLEEIENKWLHRK